MPDTKEQKHERRKRVLRLLGAVCSKCKENDATDEPHACPFASEINDDHSTDYCRCCGSCTDECADDV
jgi:hypothetical protein